MAQVIGYTRICLSAVTQDSLIFDGISSEMIERKIRLTNWVNDIEMKNTYVSEEPKVPQKLSHWINQLLNFTYVFEEPKVPQKLSHWINHLQKLTYIFEEPKVPQKLSYWVNFIKRATHVFVRLSEQRKRRPWQRHGS